MTNYLWQAARQLEAADGAAAAGVWMELAGAWTLLAAIDKGILPPALENAVIEATGGEPAVSAGQEP